MFAPCINAKQTIAKVCFLHTALPCPRQRGNFMPSVALYDPKFPHCRRLLGDYKLKVHSFTNILSVLCPAAFFVQRYCGRKECQVPPALSSGGLDGSLPQISACLGILGIPSALSRLTLVLSFPCPQ